MKLKATAAAPNPQHVAWLGKWGDADSGFTSMQLGRTPTFATADEARRAWPAVRRAVWRETHRFRVPQAAQTFDGLTFDSVEQTRASWNHVHFPLTTCLEALAGDRRNLDAFVTRDPAGAAAIADILTEVRADLDLVEAAARALAADAGPFYLCGYPHALSSSRYYGAGHGAA